mmetsp:Transcript_82320/g.245489  ORF Transcript_82320/g.245489 Transcript_82320/m.245489 type:complete len:271 (-) Transcript_82320:648-1460(-)
MSMASNTQSAAPSKCPSRAAATSSLRSVHSPWSAEKTCTSAPARLACTCTLSPSSCHSASRAPAPKRSMASAMLDGASASMGSTRTPHWALQAVAKEHGVAASATRPAASLALSPPHSACERRTASSALAMDSASACPAAASFAGAAPGPASTRACASALKTMAEDGPQWFCSTRTRCHVSRPSATDRPSSFRRPSGRLGVALTCRTRSAACSLITAATSATERSFGWKSVRCFCLAASAVSGSSAGGRDLAAAVAMSLRPKEAATASTM